MYSVLKKQNVIVNITINEIDLIKDWKDILYYQQNELVYGIGVSVCIKDENTKWIVQNFDNVVAHTIFGITTLEDYYWISESFDKVLVLGYKRKGRGRNIIPGNVFGIEEIYDLFKIVSFDNLGIEQTSIKDKVSEQEWEKSFMGEGTNRIGPDENGPHATCHGGRCAVWRGQPARVLIPRGQHERRKRAGPRGWPRVS